MSISWKEFWCRKSSRMDHALFLGKRVDADEADDFLELVFVFKQRHRFRAVDAPLSVVEAVPVFAELLRVERVAVEPVDRREVALVGELRVEAPEDLRDAERVLRYRLGKVAARRRNGSDDGDGALAPVLAEAYRTARSFVEGSEARTEVGRVSLFAGHFFKASGRVPR